MENALTALKALLESEMNAYEKLAAESSEEERADHMVEINALTITINLVEEQIDRFKMVAQLVVKR